MSGTTLPPGPGRTEIEEKKRSKQGIIMPRCGSEQRNETRGQKTGIHVGHLRVRMGQTGSWLEAAKNGRQPTAAAVSRCMREPIPWVIPNVAFVEIVAPKERIKRGQSTDVAGAQDVNPGL